MALNLTLPSPGASEDVWGGLINAYLAGLNAGKADTTVVDQLQTSVSSSLSQRVQNTVFTQYQNDQAVAIAALVPKTDYETYKAQVSTSLQGKSDLGHTHDTASITTGLLDPARLGLGAANQFAVRNSGGVLAPILLSAAANSYSAAQRTAGGQLVAATPTDATHLTTKAYVDAAVTAGVGTPTTDAGDITSGVFSPERIGLIATNRLVIRTSAGQLGVITYSTAASADTIVQRGTNGVVSVGTPTSNDHATTKAYVDARASSGSALRVWNKTTRTWPAINGSTEPVMFISTNDKTADAPTEARTEFDMWIPHVDAVNV